MTSTIEAYAEIKITVEVHGSDATVSYGDVTQAVQDAIGHTGATVEDVTEFTEVAA